MSEQKYMEILERTGLERIHHLDLRETTDYLCRTVIDVGNTEGMAGAVAERIAESDNKQ